MRKPVLISLVCGLAALALLFWGINPEPAQTVASEQRYVLLIEKDTGAFLMQLRKGMQEAAAMRGARLSVQSVSADREAQAAQLADEGVCAAILLLDDPKPMLSALEEAAVPALVVGQTLRGQVCVASDDEKAGEELLARALSLAEPSRILLLTDDEDSRGRARAQGASDLARRNQVTALPRGADMSLLREYAVIATLSGDASRQMADAKQAGLLPTDCLILGTDTGDSRVADLEKGLIAAMTLDSPYAMGHAAMEKAVALAAGILSPSLQLCHAPLIDQSNMYLSENVKLVFPLLQ